MVAIRCPFCGAELDAPAAGEPGSYRVVCDGCHRACLLEVRLILGLFRSARVHIL